MEKINLIGLFATDTQYPKLQKAAFNCLMGMEAVGFAMLVDLASKDKKDTQNFILQSFLCTPHIQVYLSNRKMLS